MDKNANAEINKICTCIIRLLISAFRIRIHIMQLIFASVRLLNVVIICYQPTDEIIDVLDYYLNLYAILNNIVINICKLK
jgi:hypothetical protein